MSEARWRMVYSGIDPSDGRRRFAKVLVGEPAPPQKQDPNKIPVPTSSELALPEEEGPTIGTKVTGSSGQTHAGHVADALARTEEISDLFAEKHKK